MLGAALWGHPPSRAQAPAVNWQPVPISAEDIRQDGDIAYMKSSVDANKLAIKEMGQLATKQGESLVALDTKLTYFFWTISVLLGGQIGFSIAPAKRRNVLSRRSEHETQ